MKLFTLSAIFVLLAANAVSEAAPPANSGQDAAPAASSQPLNKKLAKEHEARIRKLLLNRQVTAKVDFPANDNGIDLTINGDWDMKRAVDAIEDDGIGIARAAAVAITDVRLKGQCIEIHLNGGGGTQKLAVGYIADGESKPSKAKRGSRLNLRFNRQMTTADVQDLDRLLTYLEPLVDPSSLRQDARQEPMPSESAAGVKRGPIVPGMEKELVMAALGYPRYKHVDASSGTPIEKWHYDLPEKKTRVITFQGPKVLMVEEF